jgi:ketopantoate reductase
MDSQILIVGAGAIGAGIAARLQLLGYHPIFMGRKGLVDLPVRFSGWNTQFLFDTKKINEIDVTQVSLVFFATKAFDLEGAIRRIAKYLPNQCAVIPVSNGYTEPQVRNVSKEIPGKLWRNGFCSFAVSQTSEASYELRSSKGGVVFGPLTPKVNEVSYVPSSHALSKFEQDLLKRDGGEFFTWADPVEPAQHLKWFYNTVINTVCACYKLSSNGQALEKIPLMRELSGEAYKLGAEIWGPWAISEEKIFENLVALIASSASNENSMARDVRLQKRTESEWLAGLAKGRPTYPLLNLHHNQIMSFPRSGESRD